MAFQRYAADAAAALIAVPLDSLTAIYHRASGQTHLLAEPVPDILAALAATPRTLDTLLEALDLTAAEAPALRERLDELIETGLVWRV